MEICSHENFYGYEPDGLDYEVDLSTADIDDQYAHHFNYRTIKNNGTLLQVSREKKF